MQLIIGITTRELASTELSDGNPFAVAFRSVRRTTTVEVPDGALVTDVSMFVDGIILLDLPLHQDVYESDDKDA